MKLTAYDPSQNEQISQLFTTTFTASEGGSEGQVIGELAQALLTTTDSQELYCFIATDNEQIIGSIIFTKMTFEQPIKAYILSPVAIHPSYQGQGIGQKLINFGLSQLKADGVELAFTYGDPNYYSKVGYAQITEDVVKAPCKLSYPHGWLAQSLVSNEVAPIPGNSSCVEALSKPDYW